MTNPANQPKPAQARQCRGLAQDIETFNDYVNRLAVIMERLKEQ